MKVTGKRQRRKDTPINSEPANPCHGASNVRGACLSQGISNASPSARFPIISDSILTTEVCITS